MTETMWKTRTCSLIAAALLLGAFAAPAVHADSLADIVVKFAKTPEQHKAIAAYYHDEAVLARAEAAKHRRMSAEYSIGNLRRKAAMSEHCGKLTAEYEAMAKEYEALAAEHEQEAGDK